MLPSTHARFQDAIAGEIEGKRRKLAARWLERLAAAIPANPQDVFPTETLLDHVPDLIQHIARFVSAQGSDLAVNALVVMTARELGEVRHAQHASVRQLLREYELLHSVLDTCVEEQIERLRLAPPPNELMRCLRRIDEAVAILMQATVDAFVDRYAVTIEDQTRRFERFNRMVSHELRQPLGALQIAAGLLRQGDMGTGPDGDRRRRLVDTVERGVTHAIDLVATITEMTVQRGSEDRRVGVRRVSVSSVAQAAARQLRDVSRERGVEVVIAPDLPQITVDVGRLELMLSNFLSNAIKYADPAKPRRLVEVSAAQSRDAECTFQVRDNGLGMTREQLQQVFAPFVRAHADRDAELGVDGLGLGMSIARDCAEAIGASLHVDAAPGEGTTLTVTIRPNTA
jgi:signal transduction histidine kinase